jgi:hypothetical protein
MPIGRGRSPTPRPVRARRPAVVLRYHRFLLGRQTHLPAEAGCQAARVRRAADDEQVGRLYLLGVRFAHGQASDLGARRGYRAPSAIASATWWVLPNKLSYKITTFMAPSVHSSTGAMQSPWSLTPRPDGGTFSDHAFGPSRIREPAGTAGTGR